MSAHVLLVDPKYDFNVGGAVRACALFGAKSLAWTGGRVPHGGPDGLPKGFRLPREERSRDYALVSKARFPTDSDVDDWWIKMVVEQTRTPVAVERRGNAEILPEFEHPERALYVFGPEDGSLGRFWLERCHRFVTIPARIVSPLNLAAAVNVVLYDRYVKSPGSYPAKAQFDPSGDQEQPCASCGHAYRRHFDWMENDAHVGCKYCSCQEFVEEVVES